MNRRESTRIARARRRDAALMSRARPTATRSRRASSRDSRVVARARVAPSRARSRGVVYFYYFYALIYDIYDASYVHNPPSRHGSRAASYTSHCVSTPVCPNSPPTTRRVESIARSARGDARDDAMRAMRCVRARFAPIRDASERARRPRERRPSRDDRASIAMTRSRCRPRDGFEATPTVGDDATSTTRIAEDAIRRFDVSRVCETRARTARRAYTETRDGGSVARARGARTRARRRGAARRRRIKRRRATRLEDERDRTGKGEE